MDSFISKEFGKSGTSEVNLYQGDKTLGIADNHRMAYYHFAKHGLNGSHFVHIDTHPDFSPFRTECLEAVEANPNYLETPFDFMELKRLGSDLKAMEWGNWIEGLRTVFPKLISTAHICVHDNMRVFKEAWPEAFLESAPNNYPIIPPSSNCPTLYSFDIDYYFFCSGDNCGLRTNEEFQIDEKKLLEHFHKTLFLVKQAPDCLPFIALSPTCCGGWENTLPFTRIVDEVFGTNITKIIESHI